MAWHDNGWNGHVCKDPRGNTYCTGAHSLLSGRIEKRKDVNLEESFAGEPVASNFEPANVPPCYWSINAFGDSGFDVSQGHAFSSVKHRIPGMVKPYSILTWPFKLSFIHEEKNKKRHGNYPPDLDQRIDRFIGSFTPKQSVIFFYANYDNPVSADEMKYLLVGCSLISELPEPKHFPFTDEELRKFRETGKAKPGQALNMKNFPSMNWALQFTHDPGSAVLLPYKEYVRYAEEQPEDAEKLEEMRVVIEEESLVRGFKYVAMDIDDDKCLYLLYKLRRSIKKIQEHDRAVVDKDMITEEERLERLIKMTWAKRGLYPALPKVLDHFLGEEQRSSALAIEMVALLSPKYDLLALLSDLVAEDIPEALQAYEDDILELGEKRLFKNNIESLARLTLFNLTQHQVSSVIGNRDLLQEIASNPYALYEEYVAGEDDLDIPEMQDEPIDVYKVDLGMIPDRRHVQRQRKLQDLAEDSPQRIRSVYMNYLQRIGQVGHCYDQTHRMIKEVKEHPLIYKLEGVTIDEQALVHLDSDYRSHFIEKLHIARGTDVDFYYLKRIHEAEERIKAFTTQLVARADHSGSGFNVAEYIEQALMTDDLQRTLTTEEDKALFREERDKLYANIFRKSFFLLTGKPGSGKTYETSKVIEHLRGLDQQVVVLTPTGKAALRVTQNIRSNTALSDVEAMTLDKFLYEHFAAVMNGDRPLGSVTEDEKLTVENLVLDECSMLDLEKLNILFSVIRVNDRYPKRLILVGDENQLPPIGFGKPFHDMIEHIMRNAAKADLHYINLRSNCRQENDRNIIALADAFTDRHRYYEESLDLAKGEGWVSPGLYIARWSDIKTLNAALAYSMSDLFEKEGHQEAESSTVALNQLFGLYDNGYVNNGDYAFREHLKLDTLQLLTPYRSGYYGALGLNKFIQAGYRNRPTRSSENEQFYHSDKLIRLTNWYWGWGANRRMVLSNGSMGICVGEEQRRKFYFAELDRPRSSVGDMEEYDLAYAISVHRSQGSDFRNVFMIIPQKTSLLSRELIYTALTRSKYRLFLFIQENETNLLELARNTSHLLGRNTSIFQAPTDRTDRLLPDPHGKPVRSRIEYIIHQALQRSGLKFKYEHPLQLSNRSYLIHPDFTIELPSGQKLYWEHLGMLDVRKYYKDWQQRIIDYKDHGLFDQVITTDDLDGINQEKIEEVIEAMRTGSIAHTRDNRFSVHHYQLY